MNPFTALKNLSFHFIYLHFFFSLILLTLHFTLLCYSYLQLTHSLPLTSLPFTFYRLHFPSLVFTFLILVLKICVLPWEVPNAPSGSWFQSVMDLFTKEYNHVVCICWFIPMVTEHVHFKASSCLTAPSHVSTSITNYNSTHSSAHQG